MIYDFLMWAGGIIIGAAFTLIGWAFKMTHARIDKNNDVIVLLDNKIEEHKLYAANTYAKNADVKDLADKVLNKLDRMEEKSDRFHERMEEKIDKKADK